MRLSRAVVWSFAAATVLYSTLSVRHLDDPGRRYVVDSLLPGVGPRAPSPGRHFLPRGLFYVTSFPAGVDRLLIRMSGGDAPVSREGASLPVEVEIAYSIDPGHLIDLYRACGSGGVEALLSGLVRDEVARRVAAVPYEVIRDRDPGFENAIRSELQESTAGMGVRVAGLRVTPVPVAGAFGPIVTIRSGAIDREVILIGVDGFDWRVLMPLLENGNMPNVARLMSEGARANLMTIRPILSPVVWTSIATGVRPSRHGIVDFVVDAGGSGAPVPVTSASRLAPALWNILGKQGVEVTVVAWWATWPAESVPGEIVTDRVAYQLFREILPDAPDGAKGDRGGGKTFPPDLFERIAPSIRSPAGVSGDEVARYLPGGRYPETPSGEQREQLDDFRAVIASAETYHAIALDLFRERGTGLKMVYYEGPDTASHLFMRYRPPALPEVDPADRALFGGVVDRYYQEQDRYIGEILATAGTDATILLVSDHGFRSGDNRPRHSDPRIGRGSAADWHDPAGVLILAGPDIRRGIDLGAASVLDIAPTILALYGLPVPRDMDGRPLIDALTAASLDRHPIEWIDTYGGRREPDLEASAGSSEDDAAILEKLRGLGYIGDDLGTAHNNRGLIALEEGDLDAAVGWFERGLAGGGAAAAMARTNLADTWLRAGDAGKARDLAEEAVASDPRNKQAELVLARIDMEAGDLDSAGDHLRRAIAIDESFAPAHAQRGELLERIGDLDAALASYRRAVEIAPVSPNELSRIGDIHRSLGRVDEAMKAFREALRWDARHIGALNNLGLCLQDLGRLDEALDMYGRGLAIRPDNATLRNSLGTVLALMDRTADAINQFERSVRAAPDWPVPQGNLATLLHETGRTVEAEAAARRWMAIEPGSVEARSRYVAIVITLGERMAGEGRTKEALRYLERARDTGAAVPRLYNLLGEIYSASGLTTRAVRAYRESLAIDSGQAGIRQRLDALDRR